MEEQAAMTDTPKAISVALAAGKRRLRPWVRRRLDSAIYRLYEIGRDGRRPWLYAFANGLESAWTIEGWRYDEDDRARRYDGLSLPAIVVVEAANSLKANATRVLAEASTGGES